MPVVSKNTSASPAPSSASGAPPFNLANLLAGGADGTSSAASAAGSAGNTANAATATPAGGGGAPADFLQLITQLIGKAPAGAKAPTSAVPEETPTTQLSESLLLNVPPVTTQAEGVELLDEISPEPKLEGTQQDKTDDDKETPENALSADVMALLASLNAPPPAPAAAEAPLSTSAPVGADIQGVAEQKSALAALLEHLPPQPAAGDATAASAQPAATPDKNTDFNSFFAAIQSGADAVTDSSASGSAIPADLSDALNTLNNAVDSTRSATAASPVDPSTSVQAPSLHNAGVVHAAAQPATDAPAAPRELRTPVGTHGWTDELGQQLTLMAQNGHESASLKLSPENLGPLEIRISMREGEASVWFGATNSDTRSALDQSLPRLREMFASQGMVLADAGVFKEPPRGQPKPLTQNTNARIVNENDPVGDIRQISKVQLGLIDTYV